MSYFCIHHHLSNAVTGLTVIYYAPPQKKLKKIKIALCCQLPQGLAPTECFVFMAVFFFVRQWLDFMLKTINTQKKMQNNHTHVYFDCVLKQKTKTPVQDSEQLSVLWGENGCEYYRFYTFPPTLIPTAFFFLSFKLLYQQLGYDENDTAYV